MHHDYKRVPVGTESGIAWWQLLPFQVNIEDKAAVWGSTFSASAFLPLGDSRAGGHSGFLRSLEAFAPSDSPTCATVSVAERLSR